MSRRKADNAADDAVSTPPVERPADAPVTFEAMLTEVERITALLERGDLPLEQSLAAFERATRLAQEAQRLLDKAEGRLTRLIETGPGQIDEVPLELDGAEPAVANRAPHARAPTRASPPSDDA